MEEKRNWSPDSIPGRGEDASLKRRKRWIRLKLYESRDLFLDAGGSNSYEKIT